MHTCKTNKQLNGLKMAMSAYASGMYGFYSPYDRAMQPYAPYASLGPPTGAAAQQQSALMAMG